MAARKKAIAQTELVPAKKVETSNALAKLGRRRNEIGKQKPAP